MVGGIGSQPPPPVGKILLFFSPSPFSLFFPDNRHGSTPASFGFLTPHPPCCEVVSGTCRDQILFFSFLSRLQSVHPMCVSTLGQAHPLVWTTTEGNVKVTRRTVERNPKAYVFRETQADSLTNGWSPGDRFCAKSQGKRLDGGSWAVSLALDQWVHWSHPRVARPAMTCQRRWR